MLRYVLVLFLLLAVAESVALYWLATRIGLLATIGLLLAAGILGSVLFRWQGRVALDRLERELGPDSRPADTLLDGVLILTAAVLLILPGILTDVAAFALLVPPVRAGVKVLLRRGVARHFQGRVHAMTWTNGPAARDRIIDVKVTETQSSDVPAAISAEDKLRD
ncbi:MAG: FxsA family protein [Pirellulales bacterium]